jgi:Carboxypeptidase regulatory-like domain/TonB-dependent Receptor Plug Domain
MLKVHSLNSSQCRRRFLAVAAFSFLFSGAAIAQTPGTGAISGLVLDPSSHVVSDAEVTAENEATGVSRSVTTTPEGVFRVPLLLPGIYAVTVKVTGFAVNTSHSIPVTVSETTSLNVTLAVAATAERVQVQGGAQGVELESSTLGGVVDEQAIRTLPLSNRNYTQILGLSPGVVVALPNAAELGRGTQDVSSNGATTTSNNIQFNGVDANNLAENSAENANEEVGTAIPAPDAIQEFRVQTANFDAAYGRGSGANVDLVSKSGTNNFHGSAWEFLRNNLFNANDFFLKNAGQPRPDLKQNQFGGSIGGPIVKGKTFFFAAYEGLTEVNGLGGKQTAILPLLTGDRSAATLGAQFCPDGHMNEQGQPAAGYLTHAGGTQVACDGSNINPVALAILNAKLSNGQFAVPSPQVPLPNTDPDQLPVGQSTYAIPAYYREDQFSVDIDQALSQRNTLSGRFFYARAPTTQPFSPAAATVPGWGTDELDRNTMFVLADTHIFTSNLVNIARFGYMRFDGLSTVQNPLLASAIGEGTPTGAVDPSSPAPGLTIDGLFTIGDAGTPSQWQVTNTFVWQDTLAYSRGWQNMRFGAEAKRHEVDVDAPEQTTGLLDISTFDDFLLGQSATQNGSPQGLSNVTESMAGGGNFRRDERYTDFAAFAQDDLKLTPQRLTLNLGLRYEIFGAPTEIHGRLANFDADTAEGQVPPSGSFSGFTVPSNFQATIPDGVTQTSYAGLWKTPLTDISPRLGFAWQMTEKPLIVLRGGYGVYFDRHSGNLAESTLGQLPFSTLQIVSGEPNGPATLQSPFVPLVLPTSSYPIFMPRTPTSVPFIQGTDPNMRDGRTQEYNLNLQYLLGRNYVLQVGYVGTTSGHRPGQIEFDQALLASPQNPVNGQTTNSVNNVINRLPIAGVSPGSLFTESHFIANYNSLQVSASRQMQHGLQLQASYTWSKSLNETSGSGGADTFELWLLTNDQHNPRQAYGLTDFDRAERAVVSFIWSAPTFSSAPQMARKVFGNWEFSGIAVFQSGSPLTITDANAGSVYGNLPGQVRAQRTGSNPSTNGSLYSRVIGSYLDPNAFTRAPEAPNGTSLADQDFGNSGVGIVRGPGQHNLDLAIERLFPIKGTSSLNFRTEFFNLTNTPQFSNPSTSIGYGDPTAIQPVASASFGRITSSATNPRIIQFALKYRF